MALPRQLEKRSFGRKRIRQLPGLVFKASDRKTPIEVVPIDTSAEGLGVMSAEVMEPETELILIEDDLEISLRVTFRIKEWGVPRELATHNLPRTAKIFRYGLRVDMPGGFDWLEYLAEKGLID